jgi:hypothetical protein
MKYLLFTFFLSCSVYTSQAQNMPLRQIFGSLPSKMDTLLDQPDKYRIQIVYTQIDRDARNRPHFQTFSFGDTAQYFYPASTVKMPAAFLALEKLNALGIVGATHNSTMLTGAGRAPQTPVQSDSTALSGLPSIAHYVRKIFLVSDNDAFNRLYEFLGQEFLNQKLREKGYQRTRIVHRLSVSGFDTIANQYTNPVSILDSTGKLCYFQGEVFSKCPPGKLGLGSQSLGKGYVGANNALVEQPFDFSFRNYMGLRELHDMLQAVLFPDAVPKKRRFRLNEADDALLLRAMSMVPAESDYPRYDPKTYYDRYVKFLMFGDSTEKPMPPHIRVFNKVGNAYGFLTDVAYIVDFKNKVEFLLAATIHVNSDGIFNDNQYEYDTIGYPFLGALGRAVYQYELSRPVRHKPDLSRFEPYRERK